MKKLAFGDILSVQRGLIVHGCNAQGKMNSGIAKHIRAAYPGCFTVYEQHVATLRQAAQPVLGTVVIYETPGPIIVNAITQEHFGRDGKQYVSYRAISEVFGSIAAAAAHMQLDVHYPLIGAGLGGGDWAVISDIIDCQFSRYPEVNHTLWIHE